MFLWGQFDFRLLLTTFSMGMMTITSLCYIAAILFGVPVYLACLHWVGRMSIWFCLIGGALIGEVAADIVVMVINHTTTGEHAGWRLNLIFPIVGLIAGAAFWSILRTGSSAPNP